jgi:transcriptional regulator with XRE-family HTH domain
MRFLAVEELDDVRVIIRATMQEKGMSQKQLADRLYVREKHMSHMLNGHKNITLSMLMHMLRALDTAIVLDGRAEETPAQRYG